MQTGLYRLFASVITFPFVQGARASVPRDLIIFMLRQLFLEIRFFVRISNFGMPLATF